MQLRRSWFTVLIATAAVMIAALIPLAAGSYWTGVLTSVALFCVGGVGLNLVMGYAGQFSLASAAFFATGAYVSALVVMKLHVAFWPAFVLGAVAAGGFGLVVGGVSLRLKGIYFAITTFVAVLLVNTLLVHFRSLTGGSDGLVISYQPPDISLFGNKLISLGSVTSYYYLSLAALVASLTFVGLLVRSRAGRALAAIRHDEVAARALGIATTRYKLQAFLASGIIGGVAGGLIAPYLSYVAPSMFDTNATLQFLAIVIIGGLGTAVGPIVGAVVVIGLPEAFSVTGNAEVFVYGVAIIVIILVLPEGIAGSVARLATLARSRSLRARGARPNVDWVDASANVTSGAGHPKNGALGADEGWRAHAESIVPDSMAVRLAKRGCADTEPLLRVSGVSKAYRGVRALEDVTIQVHEGELLGLIGPNGAGKTTLFDVVTGLARCDRGEVLLRGEPITNLPTDRIARKGVVRTFQLSRVFPKLTVRENVVIACHMLGKGGTLTDLGRTRGTRSSEQRITEAADQALEFFGLVDCANVVAMNLPYGRGRIVGVAMAAVSKPRVLLLDEPAAGLNPEENIALAQVVRSLNRAGTTIWVVEHNMTFLMSLVDRVVVVAQGGVIADGSPREIQGDPNVATVYLGHHAAAH